MRSPNHHINEEETTMAKNACGYKTERRAKVTDKPIKNQRPPAELGRGFFKIHLHTSGFAGGRYLSMIFQSVHLGIFRSFSWFGLSVW
jgi:hypothetical protein